MFFSPIFFSFFEAFFKKPKTFWTQVIVHQGEIGETFYLLEEKHLSLGKTRLVVFSGF